MHGKKSLYSQIIDDYGHYRMWSMVMTQLLEIFHAVELIYSHFQFSFDEDTCYRHYISLYLASENSALDEEVEEEQCFDLMLFHN